ncbi:MAG: hypothetical protein L0Y72_14885 [Gemmataceae bacterium]|nr:hypothetical protein [Gemmataceae bacterium]MCI0740328.1 hypothetical protein [Gemmataceae bacterium]
MAKQPDEHARKPEEEHEDVLDADDILEGDDAPKTMATKSQQSEIRTSQGPEITSTGKPESKPAAQPEKKVSGQAEKKSSGEIERIHAAREEKKASGKPERKSSGEIERIPSAQKSAEAKHEMDAGPPTMIAKKSPQPTMLAQPGDKTTGLDLPTPPPAAGSEDVLSGESKGTGSSAVDAEVVDSSAVEAEQVAESTSADDLFSTEFKNLPKEPGESSSSIFGSDEFKVPGSGSIKTSPSLARKEETLEEILQEAISPQRGADLDEDALETGPPAASKRKKDSAVNLDADSVDLGALGGEGESATMTPALKRTGDGPLSGVDRVAEELESGTKLDKRTQIADLDSVSDDALLAGDQPASSKDLFDEEESDQKLAAKPAKAKPAKAFVKDEDEEEQPPKKTLAPPAKKEMNKFLVGALCGILATAVIGLGASFMGLLPGSSKNQQQPSKGGGGVVQQPQVPQVPVAQKARDFMLDGQFDQALEVLADAEKTPANLSTRGEARWLKYVQEQIAKKAPLDPKAPEIQQALADLGEAKNDLLVQQIKSTVDANSLRASVATLQTQAKNLAAELTKAKNAKPPVDERFNDIAKAFVDGKIIPDGNKLNAAMVQNFLKDLSANRAAVASVNKVLEKANIKEAGEKGVEQLVGAMEELDGKLAAVNKALEKEKIKDVQELVTARNSLAKERDTLDQALRSAYKELEAAQASSGEPVALQRPNAILAEQIFGKGLHLFWTKKYAAAEDQFKQALDYYGHDARYFYYLGLAQLAQKSAAKREAAHQAFDKAVKLELDRRPDVAVVNYSLERLPGDMRAMIHEWRQKAVTPRQ